MANKYGIFNDDYTEEEIMNNTFPKNKEVIYKATDSHKLIFLDKTSGEVVGSTATAADINPTKNVGTNARTYYYQVVDEDGQQLVTPTFTTANSDKELLIHINNEYNFSDTMEAGTWRVDFVRAKEAYLDLKADASLDKEKEKKYDEIDARTGELLSVGFTYDGAQFSLSINAQMNWSEIHSNKALLTFPMDISTKDSDVYTLTEEHIEAFWATGAMTLQAVVNSGRILKKLVHDCTNKNDVKAINDER